MNEWTNESSYNVAEKVDFLIEISLCLHNFHIKVQCVNSTRIEWQWSIVCSAVITKQFWVFADLFICRGTNYCFCLTKQQLLQISTQTITLRWLFHLKLVIRRYNRVLGLIQATGVNGRTLQVLNRHWVGFIWVCCIWVCFKKHCKHVHSENEWMKRLTKTTRVNEVVSLGLQDPKQINKRLNWVIKQQVVL